MDETSFDAVPPDRDASSRFADVLRRAYGEDGRALPDDITRLMIDLSRIDPAETRPASATSAPGERPVAAPMTRRSPLVAWMGRLRRRT